MSWRTKFTKIYLVATGGAAGTEFRVAERVGKARPASVQFSVTKTVGPDNLPIGTLVLDEQLWNTWFGGKSLLPGMETAEQASNTMVSTTPEIFYGCPLCDWLTKDLAEHRRHVSEHANKLIQFLDFELEEINDETT